jgi:cellulose synthase/poly-beta-1,6-N-acetylglucosamine synthase-like glycosyltransferase
MEAIIIYTSLQLKRSSGPRRRIALPTRAPGQLGDTAGLKDRQTSAAHGMMYGNSMARRRYVLVTAAYNEERHIADTLRSVSNQSLKPYQWVIVSDGSTDKTDQIVREWAGRHPFIKLVRVEKSEGHDFATKVRALHRGFERLADIDYDFIGVLDADLSFEPNYFECVLEHFANEPRLGIAGGDIEQLVDGTVVPRVKDLNSVAGAVQLVRRECFEQTGGLPALRYGGEDAAMEITARMHGWETRTFPELKVAHFGLSILVTIPCFSWRAPPTARKNDPIS